PFAGTPAIHVGAAGFFVCLALGIFFMARALKRVIAALPGSEHYRCGSFYVNRDDPRLWVPKRIGAGWTLNYARPAAWWVTVLLILPVVAPAVAWIVTRR
ncbi:MAG TPA: DUF5808 domain-containing protein, partial [Holophaga sp.]|nr:DUF5808 domain-containing protein [Holophaga sp.]